MKKPDLAIKLIHKTLSRKYRPSGVGRQYLGEIGKTENGVVIITTHLYDGVRSLP
ncbi:MAG: hypothetical protein MGG37_19660 [Trichodesmium sp. MAG_R01]|nr:hypothetical protein [Trichodesmium sp. MAG_R01]